MRILGYGMALVREQTAAVERAESRLNGEVVLFRRNVSPLWQARFDNRWLRLDQRKHPQFFRRARAVQTRLDLFVNN